MGVSSNGSWCLPMIVYEASSSQEPDDAPVPCTLLEKSTDICTDLPPYALQGLARLCQHKGPFSAASIPQ